MNDNTQRFIAKLESRYGTIERPKYSDEDRNEIASFLIRRYADHLDTLGMVMTAVRENCQIFYGLPELAKIVEAINKFQKDYGEKIQFKEQRAHPIDKDALIEQREETLGDLKREAEKIGIDTRSEHWVAKYAMKKIETKRGEK